MRPLLFAYALVAVLCALAVAVVLNGPAFDVGARIAAMAASLSH